MKLNPLGKPDFTICDSAFDFELFEMGKKEELTKKWPHHKDLLEKLCRT